MAEYEFAVYLSEALYDYADDRYADPFRPQERTLRYVEGAFRRTPHDVRFDAPSSTVPAPTEEHNTPFSAPCPADADRTCSYASLIRWFRDWLVTTGARQGADGTVLLTSTGEMNGGIAAGRRCVVRTGRLLCELPARYEPFGYLDHHDGIHSVLHELGHILLSDVGDSDCDDIGHHDTGAVYDRPFGRTISPMGLQRATNECGTTFRTDNVVGHELGWSPCCVSRWRPPVGG